MPAPPLYLVTPIQIRFQPKFMKVVSLSVPSYLMSIPEQFRNLLTLSI
jgi:hypothetical protein